MSTTTSHRRPTNYNAIESDESSSLLIENHDDDPHNNDIENDRRRRGELRQSNNRLKRAMFFTLLLFLASSSIALMAVVSEGSMEDVSDWLEENWELGIRGRLAQRIADQSPINIVGSPQSDIHPTTDAQDNPNMQPMLGSSHNFLSPIPGEGCETTVMLVRHCEKSNLKSHCNFVGYERATYLSTIFGKRWPLPSKVYALKTKRKHHENLREIETVHFVAQKAGVEIDTGYGTSHTSKLANTLVRSIQRGEMCGKMILISWKHSDLPKLAHHLGCGPMQGCPADYRGAQFDQVWQIKYVFRSFLQSMTTTSSRKRIDQHWDVFGSVQYENFDPLEFSMKVGDYPTNGTSHGARWNLSPRIEFYG